MCVDPNCEEGESGAIGVGLEPWVRVRGGEGHGSIVELSRNRRSWSQGTFHQRSKCGD